MLVVSWTGEELEVYRGMNLPSNGIRFYGVMAQSGDQFFLGRWNQQQISWQVGTKIPEATVLAAFK